MSKDNKQQNTQPPEEPAKEVPETEETSCPEGDPSQAPLPEETPEPSELEKAQAEIERLNDQLLRTLAEYDNYRKRSTREREALYPEAEAGILVKVLPVMDNFQRAMEAPCTDEKFKEGMEMILRAFQDTLKGLGVEEIGEEGEPFDPLKHNAVMHVDDEEAGDNMVVEELQKGYTYKGFVVRHSMVKVAN